MLHTVKEKAAGRPVVNFTSTIPEREPASLGFLSVEEFREAAITRLNALKMAYLQQLDGHPVEQTQ